MDKEITTLNEVDYDSEYSVNGIEESSLSLNSINNTSINCNQTNVLNPIQIILNTNAISSNSNSYSNNLTYEFTIYYLDDKWTINKTLHQIQDYIQSLQSLMLDFLPYEELSNLQSNKSINKLLSFLMKYISYRYDILMASSSIAFFNFNQYSKLSQLTQFITNKTLHSLYKFTIESNEQNASDLIYDYDSGLLLLAYEDVSLLSTIGRFWSIIDAEPLGSLRIYQRLFDDKQKPYFTKAIIKRFDVRLTKINMSNNLNRIFVGFENGTVHTFNINYLHSSLLPNKNKSITNKKIAITEGIKFKHLNDSITGFGFLSNYVFIASKNNKIIIALFSSDCLSEMPEIVFNASIKKRIEGKGNIDNIKVDQSSLKLYIISSNKIILIYNIINNADKSIKIAFWKEIQCIETIKSIYFKDDMLFVALMNKIQYFMLNGDSNHTNVVNLDGRIDNKDRYSMKYFTLNYSNSIESICYFNSLQLFILGLTSGTLLTLSSKSLEVMFAKKITQYPIIRLMLLEDNYVLIAGDQKGSTFFYRFGSE